LRTPSTPPKTFCNSLEEKKMRSGWPSNRKWVGFWNSSIHRSQQGVISLVRVNPGGIERLGNGVSWSWGARADKWRW
jgi:hypothetical protein